jgi:hypothetical protein
LGTKRRVLKMVASFVESADGLVYLLSRDKFVVWMPTLHRTVDATEQARLETSGVTSGSAVE